MNAELLAAYFEKWFIVLCGLYAVHGCPAKGYILVKTVCSVKFSIE